MAYARINSVGDSSSALRDFLKAKMDAAALEQVRNIARAIATRRVVRPPSPVERAEFYMLAVVTLTIHGGQQKDIDRFDRLLRSVCRRYYGTDNTVPPYFQAKIVAQELIDEYTLPHPIVRYIHSVWNRYHGRKDQMSA